MQAQINSFLAYLYTEKQLSSHTLSAYRRDIEHLTGFLEEKKVSNWSQVNQQHIRLFTNSLRLKQLASKSIQRMLSSCRSFFNYLLKEKIIKVNPADAISAPKAPQKLPKTLDVDQISQLLSESKNSDAPLVIRDHAIMELFYSSGLRLSELSNLNMNDIDFKDASMRVTGKGRKTRELPIGTKALQALQVWLKVRATLAPINEGSTQEQAVFITQKGTRISNRSIQSRLKKWAQEKGIGTHLHPHMLRHSFASHMLESSSDLRAVQELLGHADISTTQIYTHLDFQHLAKVYDKAHPRAKKSSTDL
jgi:integrase/recombinase XerC